MSERLCTRKGNESLNHLNHGFQNCKACQNRLNRYREIARLNMTQNDHVYAICCRPEVASDVVICRENVKTVEICALLNFEVVSFSSFRDIKKFIS